MTDPIFFRTKGPLTIDEIAALTGAALAGVSRGPRGISAIAPLDQAGPDHLTFLENPHYLPLLDSTSAGAVLIAPKFVVRAPPGLVLLVVAEPYRAFAQVALALHPDASRPRSMFGSTGISPGALVHPEARLEAGVIVDPGAVIGPRAEIGSGTIIASNAVIGPDVRIGRDCSIGANVTLQHCLVGNRVILHPGVQIGQDGFGFAMGPRGHLKVPQIGRVVIQDDVEIGANTTIDRGANRDTVIGEGTKIDNQVQIGHNVDGRPALRPRRQGRHFRLDHSRGFRRHGRRVGHGRPYPDRHGRSDRRRLQCQGRRAGRRQDGRNAGTADPRVRAGARGDQANSPRRRQGGRRAWATRTNEVDDD